VLKKIFIHTSLHNAFVCLLLDVGGPAVTIWTASWHWYWQSNEHRKPQRIYISHWEMSTSHFYSYLLYTKLHLQRCIVSRRARAKIIAWHVHSYSRRIEENEMLYIYVVRKKRKIIMHYHHGWNSFCFYFWFGHF